jgi:hypothetical protein
MLQRVMGRCGLSQPGGLSYLQLCSRGFLFILVDQDLKLCRKFRIGCADRQALEEKRPIVQLLAPELLERFVVLFVHRAPPRKLHALTRPIRILKLNPVPARQEKPVNC